MDEEALLAIENLVLQTLLKELAAALLASGALSRGDIAGALLRTEALADLADAISPEDNGVIGAASGFAVQILEDWQKRFGLPPQLYALRKAQADWLRNARTPRQPIDEYEVRRLFGPERR
jgi:hypothetical protein